MNVPGWPGVAGQLHGDAATGKHVRDGYVAVHLQRAAYQLLQRVAGRAGDDESATVARRNRADAEHLAEVLDNSWDLDADLSLKQEGVQGAPPVEPPGSLTGHATVERGEP